MDRIESRPKNDQITRRQFLKVAGEKTRDAFFVAQAIHHTPFFLRGMQDVVENITHAEAKRIFGAFDEIPFTNSVTRKPFDIPPLNAVQLSRFTQHPLWGARIVNKIGPELVDSICIIPHPVNVERGAKSTGVLQILLQDRIFDDTKTMDGTRKTRNLSVGLFDISNATPDKGFTLQSNNENDLPVVTTGGARTDILEQFKKGQIRTIDQSTFLGSRHTRTGIKDGYDQEFLVFDPQTKPSYIGVRTWHRILAGEYSNALVAENIEHLHLGLLFDIEKPDNTNQGKVPNDNWAEFVPLSHYFPTG